MAPQNLEALDRRLQSIVASSDAGQENTSASRTAESTVDGKKHICSQCAGAFGTPSGLAGHYRAKHISTDQFICPHEGCELRFRTKIACRDHHRNAHTFACGDPHCGRHFASGSLLAQHETEHTRQDRNFQTRTCPYPGCGQVFPDQAALFVHYDGLHPLSIHSPDQKHPYKCPFCFKKYATERYMAGHQRRDHSTNEGLSMEQEADQAALIWESNDSMARRASLEVKEDLPITSLPPIATTEPKIKIEEPEISIEKHTIYMEKQVDPSSPRSHQVNAGISQSQREKMAIGYVLQPVSHIQVPQTPANRDMEDDDDYPESLALDNDDMPRTHLQSQPQTSDRFSSDVVGQRIICWILTLLDMNHWLTISEVLEFWDAFLTPAQRVIILQQLTQIDVGQDHTAILSALHGSVLCEVIHAWARFKLLTLQLPEELKQHARSAKGTTYAVLKYCTEIENLIREGQMMANSLGHVWPVSLREAPRDEGNVRVDAPFLDLLGALEARVRCRKAHPTWMQFTNELVLKEMTRYVEDLKTEAEATRSLNLRTVDWFGWMNLL